MKHAQSTVQWKGTATHARVSCLHLLQFQIASSQLILLHLQLCRACFYEVFEEEVHQTIIANRLFKAGEKVAIGASGMFTPEILQTCCMHADQLIDMNYIAVSNGTSVISSLAVTSLTCS